MSNAVAVKSISLYFSEGNSDKEYHAQIKQDNTISGDNYTVDFQYGRRGGTLQTGTKTTNPVSLSKAESIYDKLVKEKVGKGYSPEVSGVAFAGTTLQGRVSGFSPELLNPIELDEADNLINNDLFWMQEKHDGERRLIQKLSNGVVEGINKKGLYVDLPLAVSDAIADIPVQCVLDGELVGDVFHVFDIIQHNSDDVRGKSYSARLDLLGGLLLGQAPLSPIRLVKTAKTSAEKRDFFENIKSSEGEGVVFKNSSANYIVGKSHTDQKKFKFYTECSVIVELINDKRSVGMQVVDGSDRISVGNVTIPANADIPRVDDVIEVKYLYAYKGGSLYQPQFKSVRSDVDHSECVIEQLKYKPEPKAKVKM